MFFVRILAAFRVHGGLPDNLAQGNQARMKWGFTRVVKIDPFVTQAFGDHLLHFRESAVRLDGGRDNVPSIAQREELSPYNEGSRRLTTTRVCQHRRAHRERVELDVLALTVRIRTLEGLYFKSHLTFGEITSLEEEGRPWYRRFPPLGTQFPHGRVGLIFRCTRRRKGRSDPRHRVCIGNVYVPPLEKPRQGCPWRDSLEVPDPYFPIRNNALSEARRMSIGRVVRLRAVP